MLKSTLLDPSQVTVSYLLTDHLGTPRVITDGQGVELSRQDYYPYGESVELKVQNENQEEKNNTESIRFTGKERDELTTLDYFGARYYGNQPGKWLSVDPIQDGWSRYAYVGGNPIAFIDPEGREIRIHDSQ